VRHVADADTELIGENHGELALVDHAQADYDVSQALAGLLLLLEGLQQLALRDQALLDEKIAEQDARRVPALDRRDFVFGGLNWRRGRLAVRRAAVECGRCRLISTEGPIGTQRALAGGVIRMILVNRMGAERPLGRWRGRVLACNRLRRRRLARSRWCWGRRGRCC
jgi:hypothetical protein